MGALHASAGVDGAASARWHALRRADDIQYAPLPPHQASPPPGWLAALGHVLARIFAPLARALGTFWPMFEVLLVLTAAAMVALLLWHWLSPLLGWRRASKTALAEPEWAPSRGEAGALLADADRLAGEGAFDAAVHLLLRRSVEHIAAARPGWLLPASTAREISALKPLPAPARSAFGLIAGLVERSRYALRPLGAPDWSAARGAYADFALQRFEGMAE